MMTKGKWKKIASLALAAILTLSLAAPGFASVGTTTGVADNSLTVVSDTNGHTYELYQILGGDVDTIGDDVYLADVLWGDGVNYANLASALAGNTTLNTYFTFANISDPQASELADGLAAIAEAGSTDLTNAFAVVVNANLSNTYVASSTGNKNTDDKYEYEFLGLYDGYYLLKDSDGSIEVSESKDMAAYTLYILQIVDGDYEINAKTDTTTIEKHIVNPHTDDNHPELEKTEEYSIGDPITYQLDSTVPDMQYYNSYWYVVKDELCEGLTFDHIESIQIGSGSSAITLEEKSASSSSAYTYELTVDPTTGEGAEITIVFNDFYENYLEYKDDPITIQYVVRLNEKAQVGETGNDNTVYLIYSNNPNYTYDGDYDENDENVGQTTIRKTITYTAKVQILKVDKDDSTKTLAGAEFELSHDTSSFYVLSEASDSYYKQDENGAYYRTSDDGVVPEVYELYGGSEAGHTESSRRYSLVSTSTIVTTEEVAAGGGTVTVVTDSDGYATFTGLGAGTYTLTEVTAPSGYNLLTDPIEFTIEYTDPTLDPDTVPSTSNLTAEWTVTMSNDNASASVTDGVITITVKNSPASLLPSTGGMGILIYVAVGLCAMTGAVVVLRARNRREEE